MAIGSLQLNCGLTGPALTAGLPQISSTKWTLVEALAENGGAEALSHQAEEVLYGKSQAYFGKGGIAANWQQECLWQELFSDPAQWWDNRRRKKTPQHPDFRHKKSKDALWLNNRYKPAWVESQLAIWDAGMERPPGTWGRIASGRLEAHAVNLDVKTCRKLCEDGELTEAVDALDLLVLQGRHIPNNPFYHVLRRCTALKDLVLGRHIHALAVKSGYEGDAFLATHLIGLYASHGRLDEAMKVFTKVSAPDAYNWASIIFAYARHGKPTQAIELYRQMCKSTFQPDNHIFVAVLKACASAGDLAAGKDVHAHVVASAEKPEIFVQNGLVDMYAKCGSIEDARRVFDRLAHKDVVTWNVMIAGYAQQGMGQEALSLYSSMQQEGITPADSFTFACLLQACVRIECLHQGQRLHAQIEELGLQDGVVVGGSLVNMYAKCGRLEDARKVFDRLPDKNVVTWNAMITGYVQQGPCHEALDLYSAMQQEGITLPDSVTFVCLLQACASIGVVALHQGKQLHTEAEERGLQDDVAVGASLVNMYAKCGGLEIAHRLFDKLPEKNVVTWTAMIAGYAQQGMGQEALALYTSMQQEGINIPDSVTFVCVLQACATVAALPLGKQLHAQIQDRGLQAQGNVGPSLVNMYAKCGSMGDAQLVFDSLPQRDISAWGALTAGYTCQGDSEAVFALLDKMRLEGVQPDGITFLNVLTLCSHVGLVDKGRHYFQVMGTEYGLTPAIDHYICMMDLLGRAGHLEEALGMAKTMPFPPNAAVWLALLGACRTWANVEVGQQAFEFAVSLDEKDASSYVLMASIYSGAQMWEEARQMQVRRVKCGAWKHPGQSWWTNMGGVTHTFLAAEGRHSNISSSEDVNDGNEGTHRFSQRGNMG